MTNNGTYALLGGLLIVLVGALIWLWSSNLAGIIVICIGVAVLLLYLFIRNGTAAGEQTELTHEGPAS